MESKADNNALRIRYSAGSLNRADLPPEPFSHFALWLKQAQEADLPYPTGMSLATASQSGEVTSRIVLLRYFDHSGFVFFSGFDTKKAKHISENTQVALLFPWLMLQRQVKIMGTAVEISNTESLRFFTTRSRDSQIGAWLSQSSEVVSSRSILQSKLEEMKQKFRDGQVPLPGQWGGYRVAAKSIEFWQGRSSGVHDRFVYSTTVEGEWQLERLAP